MLKFYKTLLMIWATIIAMNGLEAKKYIVTAFFKKNKELTDDNKKEISSALKDLAKDKDDFDKYGEVERGMYARLDFSKNSIQFLLDTDKNEDEIIEAISKLNLPDLKVTIIQD